MTKSREIASRSFLFAHFSVYWLEIGKLEDDKLEIKIGLLGFGTVGVGVYDMLYNNKDKVTQMTQTTLTVEKILVRNIDKHAEAIASGMPITDQIDDIIQDDTIQIVVEVVGSVDMAKDYISRALKAGKNVVTANKDLLALHGDELNQLAQENGKDLFFEASVAGGIPIIRTLMDNYIGDTIEEVSGIINGTTNFMLTQMQEENKTYDEALKLAQELGYAESDPTGDVAGLDAARKMVILTKLAFGYRASLDELSVTGITGIEVADFAAAKQKGYTLKLISQSRAENKQIFVEVAPMLVPLDHQLASVQNVNNAVIVKGEASGENSYMGPGAGRLPTANSVVSDVTQIAKNIRTKQTGHSNLYTSNIYTKWTQAESPQDALIRLKGTEKAVDNFITQQKEIGVILTSVALNTEAENKDTHYVFGTALLLSQLKDHTDVKIDAIYHTI